MTRTPPLRRTLGLAAAVGLSVGLWLAPAGARQVEGVEFADSVSLADESLELRGLGLLRYRWVFKAYVAALYLPPGVASGRVLEDVPKRLEIEYFWSIDGSDFGPAADELLRRNFEPAALAPLRERLDRLHAAYRDVDPGDRYALDYAPGVGTTLSKNGEPLRTIPGADFQAAYFAIWLGAAPLDADLRRELLALP